MNVRMMVSDTTNASHLVAIVRGDVLAGYRVVETTDGGRTWMKGADVPSTDLDGFAGFDCKRMYLGDAYGATGTVLRTSDGGTTWRTSPVAKSPMSLCAHPTDSNTVYMVGAGFLGKSADAGETWTFNDHSALTQIIAQIANEPCLVISPSNPDYMLVSGRKYSSGQWYAFAALSTNGGMAWLDISSRIDTNADSQLYAAAFDPNDHRRMYLSGHYFYASADGGATWQKNTAPASVWNSYTDGMCVLAVDPVNSSNIYGAYSLDLGAPSYKYRIGLLVSRDYGANWIRIEDPQMRGAGSPTQIEVMKTCPSNILVSSSSGFYRSYDAGQTLAGADTYYSSDGVNALGVSATRLVASTASGLFRSDNGGDDWTRMAGGNYKSCEINPSDPNTMLAVMDAG